jgi:two-component system chemotaxis response regulator CheB
MNGAEALPLVQRLRPDVICTDYHMPVMDGLEFTKRVMAEFPSPILILSVSVQPSQTSNILQMIEIGAIDVMPKPLAMQGGVKNLDAQRLIEKIRILKGVRCIPLKSQNHNGVRHAPRFSGNGNLPPRVVCIGSSTGGPQALYRVLPVLPKNFPIPVICVQHISPGFLQGLVDWLANVCTIKLRIASHGVRPEPGHVYFAPEGKNLWLNEQGVFQVEEPELNDIYIPNIDVLFSSVCAYYRGATVGVLLSGMGHDGVEGLRTIQAQAGVTMIQDEATSVIFGMPGAALAAGVAQDVLPIELIGPALVNLVPTISKGAQ